MNFEAENFTKEEYYATMLSHKIARQMELKNTLKATLPDGVLNKDLYQRLAAGDLVAPEPRFTRIFELADEYALRLREAGEAEAGLAVVLDQRFRQTISDLSELPMKSGRARPTDEDYQTVDDALENAGEELGGLAGKLLGSFSYNSLGEAYNGVQVYSPDRAKLILETVSNSPALRTLVERITVLHEKAIAEGNPSLGNPPGEAEADVNKILSFEGTWKYFSPLKPARVLLERFRTTLLRHCLEVLKKQLRAGLPASKGGRVLEGRELDFFIKGMDLSPDMFDMDALSKRDLLNHPLGQALSAGAGDAYKYAKKLEEERLGAAAATYGFIYLDEGQAKALNLLPDEGKFSTEFLYFNQPYYAVPYGTYSLAKQPEKFKGMLQTILEMGEVYPGTPVDEYAQAFHAYLSYGSQGGNATEYSKICYEAECAWVRYVRYATESGLPFIFVHPFEHDTVPSLKEHDFSLCPIANERQEGATELQKMFVANVEAFFRREGLLERYPAMCAATLERLSKIEITLVETRLASTVASILAQTVPNYELGQKEGLVLLGDFGYAIHNDRALSLGSAREADPLGDYASFLEGLDDATYALFYIQHLLGHELGHHIYKGEDKKGVENDGKGISWGEIEEAKASHGILFSVEDPLQLTPEEIVRLRKILPFIVDLEGVGRLVASHLKNFRNNTFTRCGALFVDYALKSGLLEVAHIKVEGEGYRVLSGEEKGGADTAFLRLHLEDEKIREFMAKMAPFWMEAAEPYAKISGFEPSEGKTVTLPDKTDCETWQILQRFLLQEELAGEGPDGRAAQELAKMEGTEDPSLKADVLAVVQWRQFEMADRLKEAVAREKGLSVTDAEVDVALEVLKQKLRKEQPQVSGVGAQV